MSNAPNHVHFTEWNKRHVETFGDKGKLGINAVKGLAICTFSLLSLLRGLTEGLLVMTVTCQDTRVE